jgi:signal transduction histidine kinase
MRSVPDDVRRARLHRGPLLALAGGGLGSLTLAALAPRLRPWLAPPRLTLFVLAAGAVGAAGYALWLGRRAPRWSSVDEAAWVAVLGTLSVLAGAAYAPVGPGLVLYAAAAIALARRDPSDALVAVAFATTVLAAVVRLIASASLAGGLSFVCAVAIALLAFLAVTAQTRRLTRALAERDAMLSDLTAFARSSYAAPATSASSERPSGVRAVRTPSQDDTRASGDRLEQGWDALVERVRASVTGMAETAGVAASVEAELSGLAPPSQKMRSQLLRIAQEATTQALRHAEARSILITLRRAEGGVVLELLDDGEAGETTRQRRTLATLRGRVAALGGTAELRRADRGWLTRVRLPCEQLN